MEKKETEMKKIPVCKEKRISGFDENVVESNYNTKMNESFGDGERRKMTAMSV